VALGLLRKTTELACESGYKYVVHRTRKSVEERLMRELQREADKRLKGDLFTRFKDDRACREVARGVQDEEAALSAGLDDGAWVLVERMR
jgi:hypothetical protein